MGCLPLVLCLAIGGGFLMSGGGLDKSADTALPESPYAAVGDGVMDGATAFLSSVEVTGDSFSHLYTSAEAVEEIIDFVEGIKVLPELYAASDSTDFIAGAGDTSFTSNHSVHGGCEILIRDQDGTSAAYRLVGSTLTDLTTGETYYMDKDTCSELKELLGIPLS